MSSHLAIILSASAVGESVLCGLSAHPDVEATADAVVAMGADATPAERGSWRVFGVGLGGFAEPPHALTPSGDGLPLLLGATATTDICATFDADRTDAGRSLGALLSKLSLFGADWLSRADGRAPLTLRGAADSVQVGSLAAASDAVEAGALALAALNAAGDSEIVAPTAYADAIEATFQRFGAAVESSTGDDGVRRWRIAGRSDLTPTTYEPPGDSSAAAHALATALFTAGGDVATIGVRRDAGLFGLVDAWTRLGARLDVSDAATAVGGGCDVRARFSDLRGADLDLRSAPALAGYLPLLCAAAVRADGTTRISGLDAADDPLLLDAIDRDFSRFGAGVLRRGSVVEIVGMGADAPDRVVRIEAGFDDRTAASLSILGLAGAPNVVIEDGDAFAHRCADVVDALRRVGASLESEG